MCQATAVGALVILLYTSRACYNLVVALSPLGRPDLCNYSWYSGSDQVNWSLLSFREGVSVKLCIYFAVFYFFLPIVI